MPIESNSNIDMLSGFGTIRESTAEQIREIQELENRILARSYRDKWTAKPKSVSLDDIGKANDEIFNKIDTLRKELRGIPMKYFDKLCLHKGYFTGALGYNFTGSEDLDEPRQRKRVESRWREMAYDLLESFGTEENNFHFIFLNRLLSFIIVDRKDTDRALLLSKELFEISKEIRVKKEELNKLLGKEEKENVCEDYLKPTGVMKRPGFVASFGGVFDRDSII